MVGNSDFAAILNAMPETGVYVIRASDHSLLYFNQRVREVSPEARLGVPCYEIWDGSCACCPLPGAEGSGEGRAVSYNAPYGGVVDITAGRILWEDSVPAFVVTVDPRADVPGYTYRKILRLDLECNRCNVLKSDSDLWKPGDAPLSESLGRFAESGLIHPEDVERFTAFISLDHIRRAQAEGRTLTLIYRRRMEEGYRWNLMEILPGQGDGSHTAVLCVKDVHDVLREGLEREGIAVRDQELIRSLGERNFNIYTIDLAVGTANPVREDGRMGEMLAAQDWDMLMRERIYGQLHSSYQDEFVRRFSLEGLRQAAEAGQQKNELLCQWRSGEDYRYISVTAYFSEDPRAVGYTVLALQDVDERMRLELAHSKRDMQMAAILKSRYQMMNTVYLDSGLCERINLAQFAGTDNVLTGDYETYIQNAVDRFVHPDDAAQFRSALSLEHLRRKAETIGEYGDEVCRYRIMGDEVRWIEVHVLYSRQKDQVMVNILGQDITREKQQEDDRLRALEDRAYMISSLSSLFFSTYYVDLEQDTFRAVTQQHKVSNLLGAEVNFTNALQLYAHHFVHPEDRERYLGAMDIGNPRETLRWWKPYVEVEYRKLPDFPELGEEGCRKVRATAVLAQTGMDDLPRTVVYVARDIGGGEDGNV